MTEPFPSSSPLSLTERLQDLTEQLAAATTPDAVFGVILAPALAALNAVAGAVLLVNELGNGLEVAATAGHEKDAQTIWQAGPLGAEMPAEDALQWGTPLFFEHAGALTAAYPELEAHTGVIAPVANDVLPMFEGKRPLGVIVLDFKEPHTFSPEEQQFLRTLSAQCGIALGRARLMSDLQRQVEQRTEQVAREARAQEAFIAFTEAVGTETEVTLLAQHSVTLLEQ
jgi:GAF domain-containing protein